MVLLYYNLDAPTRDTAGFSLRALRKRRHCVLRPAPLEPPREVISL